MQLTELAPEENTHELSAELRLQVTFGPAKPARQVKVYDVAPTMGVGLKAPGKVGSGGCESKTTSEDDNARL